VAAAECPQCGARYLGWIEGEPLNRCADLENGRRPLFGHFFDLSYRSTFNDEPGSGDLPPWQGSNEHDVEPRTLTIYDDNAIVKDLCDKCDRWPSVECEECQAIIEIELSRFREEK
jgi:hypothetical protein